MRNHILARIPTATLVRGPVCSTLTPEQIERAKRFIGVFAEVSSMSLESLTHDENPEREIRIWEDMAVAYTKSVGSCKTAADRKKLYLNILQKTLDAPETAIIVKPVGLRPWRSPFKGA